MSHARNVTRRGHKYVPKPEDNALTIEDVRAANAASARRAPLVNGAGRTVQEQAAYDKQLAEHRARRDADLAWMQGNRGGDDASPHATGA